MTPLICVLGVKHYAFSDGFKCVLIDFQVSSHGQHLVLDASPRL